MAAWHFLKQIITTANMYMKEMYCMLFQCQLIREGAYDLIYLFSITSTVLSAFGPGLPAPALPTVTLSAQAWKPLKATEKQI